MDRDDRQAEAIAADKVAKETETTVAPAWVGFIPGGDREEWDAARKPIPRLRHCPACDADVGEPVGDFMLASHWRLAWTVLDLDTGGPASEEAARELLASINEFVEERPEMWLLDAPWLSVDPIDVRIGVTFHGLIDWWSERLWRDLRLDAIGRGMDVELDTWGAFDSDRQARTEAQLAAEAAESAKAEEVASQAPTTTFHRVPADLGLLFPVDRTTGTGENKRVIPWRECLIPRLQASPSFQPFEEFSLGEFAFPPTFGRGLAGWTGRTDSAGKAGSPPKGAAVQSGNF